MTQSGIPLASPSRSAFSRSSTANRAVRKLAGIHMKRYNRGQGHSFDFREWNIVRSQGTSTRSMQSNYVKPRKSDFWESLPCNSFQSLATCSFSSSSSVLASSSSLLSIRLRRSSFFFRIIIRCVSCFIIDTHTQQGPGRTWGLLCLPLTVTLALDAGCADLTQQGPSIWKYIYNQHQVNETTNHFGDNSKDTNWCCGKASTRRIRKHVWKSRSYKKKQTG